MQKTQKLLTRTEERSRSGGNYVDPCSMLNCIEKSVIDHLHRRKQSIEDFAERDQGLQRPLTTGKN